MFPVGFMASVPDSMLFKALADRAFHSLAHGSGHAYQELGRFLLESELDRQPPYRFCSLEANTVYPARSYYALQQLFDCKEVRTQHGALATHWSGGGKSAHTLEEALRPETIHLYMDVPLLRGLEL